MSDLRIQRIFVVFIALLAATLFNQYFRYTPALNDGGLFAAMGQALNDGKVLYSGVWDNKAPGIFFLNALFLRLFDDPLTAISAMRTCFAFLLMLSILLAVQRIRGSAIYLSGLLLLIFMPTIFKWEYFMSGTYTEFYGSVFLLFAVYFGGTSNATISLLISGIFASMAILTKEPFLIPAAALGIYLILVHKKNAKKWMAFCAGCMVPVLLFFIYLMANGALTDYIQYLQFAWNYAGEKNTGNPSPLWSFFKSILADIPLLFILLIPALFSIFDNEYQKKSAHTSRLYLALALAAAAFPLLGGIAYGHYFFPLLVTLVLFAMCGIPWLLMKLNNLFSAKTKFVWLSLRVLACITLIFFAANTLNEYYVGKLYPQTKKAETERSEFQQLIGKSKTFYVEKEDMGRLYLYQTPGAWLRFPCPYYVYFGGDKPTELQLENRNKLQQQLTGYKPDVIISGKSWSSGSSYAGIVPWMEHNYTRTDSMVTVEGDLLVFWKHR